MEPDSRARVSSTLACATSTTILWAASVAVVRWIVCATCAVRALATPRLYRVKPDPRQAGSGGWLRGGAVVGIACGGDQCLRRLWRTLHRGSVPNVAPVEVILEAVMRSHRRVT